MTRALAGALKRAGFNEVDTSAALVAHADTEQWTREKGDANGGRELRRMFDAIDSRRDAPDTNGFNF